MTFPLDVKALTENISDRQLEQLCRENPDRRFELDAQGKLIIMSPTGSESGQRNGDLFGQIWYWNRQSNLGVVFDSSTGFRLSNGAIRSPDVSWIAIDRWNSLSEELKRGFAPIDPDFVIELLSPSDELVKTQQKMQEYLSCGVQLGWLINPDAKEVEIYRGRTRADDRRTLKDTASHKGTRPEGKEKEVLVNPNSLSDEEVLSGFILDLADIF